MAFDNRTNDTTERSVPVGCGCEVCKLSRFEDSKLRNAVVHAYSYRPRTWRLNNTGPTDPHNYYLGVELETDDYRINPSTGYRERSNVDNRVAADMRRPKNLWMAKHDGSVTGPEFVSHPSTLAYWRKNQKALKDMFQMLVHAGYRSHDNDNAGMHINISRNAFADGPHLFRFLSLIHASPAWSLKMSQRTAASARQWASLDYLAQAARRQSEVDRLTSGPEWARGSSSRYQALNAPSGQPRFEFRLPRGTLRIDRFFKNLEWTVAMIEYTRTHRSVASAKPLPFMRWVMAHRTDYPNLAKFLVERFENLIIVAPADMPDAIVADTTTSEPAPTAERTRRAYNRRPGANPPGRPVGYRPPRRTATFTLDFTTLPR